MKQTKNESMKALTTHLEQQARQIFLSRLHWGLGRENKRETKIQSTR
jgi:hypothetical protein